MSEATEAALDSMKWRTEEERKGLLVTLDYCEKLIAVIEAE